VATTILYGPYSVVADGGYLAPNASKNWWWGPFDYLGAVTVTAVPFSMFGSERVLTVTNVRLETKPTAKLYLYATVTNTGTDPANFFWMITSVQQ